MRILLQAVIILGIISAVRGADLYFHFDFKKAGEQAEFADLTGRATCHSRQKIFVVEHGALRLAEGAQIYIPSRQLPDLTEQFSFNIWVNPARRGLPLPLFFKGLHPAPIQFLVGISHLYPYFLYKNNGITDHWRGIETSGYPGSHLVQYTHPEYVVGDKPAEVIPGRWYMLSVVFDRGNILFYLNGELILRRPGSGTEKLQGCDFPLYLGAERIPKSQANYASANMLVNDWRLYTGALSAPDVAALYKEERSKYPEKPVMEDSWSQFPICPDYMERLIPGYDPLFRYKLPMTAEYEKSLPPQTPGGKGNTSSNVADKDGVMKMYINGQEYFPLMANGSPEEFSIHDPAVTMGKQIRNFAAAGYPLVGTIVHTWRDMILVWNGPDKYDFSSFDKAMRMAMDAAPNGLIQVSMFPEAISWFQGAHNRELERCYPGHTSKGKLQILYSGPFGSDVWLKCSPELLEALVRHMESQDYADRIYDYKLFLGGGGEWYWPGCFMGYTSGYSDATCDTFRQWLRDKYKTDAALRTAWSDQSVSLDTAVVPAPEFRFASEFFNFRDPAKARPAIDFREYMGDRTFQNIKDCTEAMKRGMDGRKTVTIYYGYGIYFANPQNPTQQTSGLHRLASVMRLPSVDHIATPITYNRRRGGQPGANYNPFSASARLHNKIIWQENDLRTHVFPKEEYGRTRDAVETQTVIRRGFGQALTSGMGFWYLPMPAYCYNEKNAQEEMSLVQQKATETIAEDRSSIAETALIFDEKSMLPVAYRQENFLNAHIWELYENLYLTGAPFDAYLTEDIADARMPDYKLYIFVNMFSTDAATRAAISAKVRKNNAVALWCYAPGLLNGQTFDDRTMQELTGLKLRHEMKLLPLQLQASKTDHPILRHGGTMPSYNVGPVVWCEDPGAEVIGKAGGKDALALRKFDNWTSVYTLMPPTKEMLAGLQEFAGVHRFNTGYDVVSANRSFIMLHAATAGDKTIRLKKPATVTDFFSGAVLGKNVLEFTDKNVPAEATRIYLIK